MDKDREVLTIACAELGVTESPPGSNRVKYNAWYYGRDVSGAAYPWCMAFVQWCFSQAGAPLPLETASCGALLRWYREHDPDCIVPLAEAMPGCVVIFDLPGTSTDTDHTGIFESAGTKYVTTIDGNTGTTNDANGGAVMRRSRPVEYIKAVIKPRAIWETEEDTQMAEKRYNTLGEIEQAEPWAVDTVRKLIGAGALRGDGAGLDLSRDMLRLLVINDRAGVYGK